MQTKIVLSFLLLVATSLSAQAQILWQAGMNDNAQPTNRTGGGPNANFVQEAGGINPLPGSPTSTHLPGGADNDYYFSGVYSLAIPSATAFYGPYTPLGVVSADENSAERAFAGADLDLRFHFNVPASVGPNDLITISYDALSLDATGGPDPLQRRFGVEVYFNGVLVAPQNIIRPPQLNQTFTTAPFTLASVNAQTGAGADNIVSLRGISYNAAGGGNWMGIDYVQANVVPEPSSIALMTLFGGMGLAVAFLRRRRGDRKRSS